MNEHDVVHGPSQIGRVIAILAVTTAIWLVADAPIQHRALALELCGLLVIAIGAATRRRGFRVAGLGLKMIGLAAIGTALAIGTLVPSGITARIEFLPGAFGIAILAWALLPVTTAGSRRRVAAGVSAVVVSILASGVMHGTDAPALLGALVAAVVAWDAGERAISLGEQVGRSADTGSVEIVNTAATATVGIAGIVLARFVYAANVTDISLVGLLFLLAAAVVLAIALYAR